MRSYILFSVVCLLLGWTNGVPAVKGVGAYSYQDSSGNRYGGTYGLDDAQVYSTKGQKNVAPRGDWDSFAGAQVYTSDNEGGWGDFAPYEQTFQQYDNFIPEYFNNLQNLLNEAFNSNFENQKLAYNAAKKAFDLTSNQASYIPSFPSRLRGYNFDGFNNFMMPFSAQNSAFAGAAAGPGFSHQIAALSPANPSEPNINVMNRFSDSPGPGKFYSVSSSSYASSANVNGREQSVRGAETLVNNNGKVTHYSVQS